MADTRLIGRGKPTRPGPLIESNPTAAATRLRARVAEIDAMNGLKDPDDARLGIAERNISSDVRDIFGPDSPEFREYEHYNIWSGAMSLNMSARDRLLARTNGLANAKVIVQSLVTLIEGQEAWRSGRMLSHGPSPRSRWSIVGA